MEYKTFVNSRTLISSIFAIHGICLVIRAYLALDIYALEILIWILGPPLWFFLEYVAIDKTWVKHPIEAPLAMNTKDAILQSTKDYANAASKIWAGVLAVLYFLVNSAEPMGHCETTSLPCNGPPHFYVWQSAPVCDCAQQCQSAPKSQIHR